MEWIVDLIDNEGRVFDTTSVDAADEKEAVLIAMDIFAENGWSVSEFPFFQFRVVIY
jgi:hypothetical protein